MKSNLLLLLLTVIGICYSCNEQEDPELLAEEQLVALITDAHLAEGALQNISYSNIDSMTQVYYQQIFEIHEITEEDYKKNLDYLTRHPAYAEKIYEKVVDRLSNLNLE